MDLMLGMKPEALAENLHNIHKANGVFALALAEDVMFNGAYDAQFAFLELRLVGKTLGPARALCQAR